MKKLMYLLLLVFMLIIANNRLVGQLNCSNSILIGVGETVNSSTTGSTTMTSYCGTNDQWTGGTRVFEVYTNQSFVVEVIGAGSTDFDLFVFFQSCSPSNCLGSGTSATGNESVTICTGGGLGLQEFNPYLIVVHAYTGNGNFSLRVSSLQSGAIEYGFLRLYDYTASNVCGQLSGELFYPFGSNNGINRYFARQGNIPGNPEFPAEEHIYRIPVSTGVVSASLSNLGDTRIDVALLARNHNTGFISCLVLADNAYSNFQLTPGFTYYVVVDSKAQWGSINQTYTLTVSYSGCIPPPPIPSCATILTPTEGSVISGIPVITWTPIAEATGYRLTVGTTSGGSQVLNNIDVGDVTRYLLINPPAQTLYVRVVPYNNNGQASNCTQRVFTYQNCTVCPTFENTRSDCIGFENYSNGNILSQGSPYFSLFPPGTAQQQASVVNTLAFSGSKSLRFSNTSNIDYNIDRSSLNSIARLEWMMYIPADKSGAWGIETNSSTTYSYLARYNNGVVNIYQSISAGNTSSTPVATFTYPQGSWFKVVVIFRPSISGSQGSIEIWQNRQFIRKRTDFSSNTIGDLNFHNLSGSTNGEYYIDNLCYQEIYTDLPCQQNIDPVCVNGQQFNNACIASRAGYTANEWTVGPCVSYCDGCLNCFKYIPKADAPRTIKFFGQECIDEVPTRGESLNLTYEWTVNNTNAQYVDGTNSTSSSPTILFPANGSYTVCYRVFVGSVLSYECCQTIVVGSCNGGPVAFYTATHNAAQNTFSLNSGQSQNAANIKWEFSETGVQFVSGNATSSNPVISIPNGKCINVCLIVSNACGMSSYCLKLCRNNTSCSGTTPPAYFTGSISPTVNDKTVSINLPSNGQATYKWNLGNGQAGPMTQNLNYTYPAYGNYIICVEVRIGCFIYCYCWCLHLNPCGGSPAMEPHDGMLSARFLGNQSTLEFQIQSSNINIAPNQPWLVDDLTVPNSTGQANLTVAMPQNRDYVICFPYIKPNGCLAYKCIRVRGGNPFSCTNINWRFVQNQGYQFNLVQSSGITEIQWTVDETGQQLGTSATSNFILPPNPCTWRNISVRYFDGTRYWICCLRIYLCLPDDCFNTIFYGATSNDQALFRLDENGATNIQWYFDDAPNTSLGTTSTITLPYPATCVAKWISVKYFLPGIGWRVCCRLIWFCNPFNCNQIRMTYIEGSGFSFELDQSYQNMSWVIDETNQSLGTGVQSNFYPVSGSECILRTVTVRYRDAQGRWWICCYRFWWCNPMNCSDKIIITQSGSNYILSTDNTAQNITWFRENVQLGTGNNLNVSLPATGNYKIYIRYYNPSNKTWYWCCRTFTPGSGGSTPPWTDPPITLFRHSIAFLNITTYTINGSPIQNGDWIGVFYNDNGTFRPAGFKKWDGGNMLIDVNGDDPSTPVKEGFSSNEVFTYRIWKSLAGQEVNVQAQYLPIGSSIGAATVNALDRFIDKALSGISRLDGTSSITIQIPIKEGWNLISSNVVPDNLALESIFSPIINQIEAVRDLNNAFIPGFFNGIGNWDIRKGYYVKSKADVTLSITGGKVNPNTTVIPIVPNWQIVSYFCDNNTPVGNSFANLLNDIEAVRTLNTAYIPGFSPADAICMRPFQGFLVKGKPGISNKALNYTCVGSCQEINDFDEQEDYILTLRNVEAQKVYSDRSALLVLPEVVLNSFINKGDILKLQTKTGGNYGEYVWNGSNQIIFILGDDLTTPVKEGFSEGEYFDVMVFSSKNQKYHKLNFDRKSLFFNNEIYRVVLSTTSNNEELVKVFPNPSKGYVNFEFQEFRKFKNVEIEIVDSRGIKLFSEKMALSNSDTGSININLTGFLPGLYFASFKSENTIFHKKFIVID